MLYQIGKLVLRFITWLFWRKDVKGLQNIPNSGGFILCSNHFSNWDPVFLVCEVPRQVHYMGKDELYHNPVMRWLLTSGGMVRVRRGASDRRAIREILKYLETGEVAGIFPEGHRSKDGELQALMVGAVYFAFKANVPLLPAAIKGDYRQLGSTIHIRFGEPLVLPKIDDPDRETMQEWTLRLSETIATLHALN